MATTSSTLVAGEVAGQGGNDNGNNGRYGLKAKLAAGVAILSCTAALAFGGLQLGNQEQRQPHAVPSAASLPAGTDDLATNGCIGTTGPFACATGQSRFGTDDLATNGCIGTVAPYGCPAGQSLAGTDDLATNACIGTTGPFGCATDWEQGTHAGGSGAGSEAQRFLEAYLSLPSGGTPGPAPADRSTDH